MQSSSVTDRAKWLMASLAILFVLACSAAGVVPATQIVEVTQIVLINEITQMTRIVPVTRIIKVTQIVEILPDAPLATEAPAQTIAQQPTPPPAPTAVEPLVNNDVIVWYDFEGNFLASEIVSDRSGNGFNSRVVGTVETDSGISGGQSISFPGNGYIQAQVNPAAGRNQVSFSLWFFTENPENNYKLASAAWWNGGPGSGWILATHIPEFWSDDTKSLFFPDIINNENQFPAGQWIHEVITYNGSRIREYTNGKLVNEWQVTGAAIGMGQSMVIGAWPPFSAYDFQGSIDEFRIFGRALSPQEVQSLYNQGE